MANPSDSTSSAPSKRHWLLAIAAALTLASLIGPISQSGIWDPHELRVADFSRRIALTLLGARELELQGAVNSVPTLGDLGRGQLPFTSVALGFKLFGLHEWAGRLPLALWGVLGILATYALVARLADRTAGALTAIALATMPLYFLHARTLLGDIVTMAAIAIATAGLGLACFDRVRDGEESSVIARRRVLALLAGTVGLAAGFGTRGLLIGVAVPALGVGSAWLITRTARTRDALGDVTGVLTLGAGAGALAYGAVALSRLHAGDPLQLMWVGAALNKPAALPTYDLVIHHLGHGLFPWSALIPFAVGRMFAAPPGADRAELARQAGLRAALVTVPAFAFGVYSLMAPVTGHLPFGAVCALAAIAALAMRDFERGAAGSRAFAMGVAAFAILFYTDFKNFPEKGLSAFAVSEARFPESFKETATKIIKYGAVAMSGAFLLSFMERQEDGSRRFVRDEYLAWPRQLRTLFDGNLLFALLVLETSLLGLAVVGFLAERGVRLPSSLGTSAVVRDAAQIGVFALPIVVLVLPAAALFARDAARELYARIPLSRGVGSLFAVAIFGAVLSFAYYPALAAQISPKQVYDSYRKLAKGGEPLGLLGVSAGSASYYAGRNVPTFGAPNAGFDWLMQGPERRWLVTRADDLAQLNQLFRSRANPPRNLPVLDARSSEILLVSSALGPGEENRNPLDAWISSQPPKPSRALDVVLGNQLQVLGWDVKTSKGATVSSVVPGKPYQFIIHYKVLAPVSGSWETFIHIDGFQRRFNGDHKTLEGKYPFHLWRVGDYISDVYTFRLEPNFTPGTYNVFFGLFMGDRRLEVTRGPAHEDRIEAGTLAVR